MISHKSDLVVNATEYFKATSEFAVHVHSHITHTKEALGHFCRFDMMNAQEKVLSETHKKI